MVHKSYKYLQLSYILDPLKIMPLGLSYIMFLSSSFHAKTILTKSPFLGGIILSSGSRRQKIGVKLFGVQRAMKSCFQKLRNEYFFSRSPENG